MGNPPLFRCGRARPAPPAPTGSFKVLVLWFIGFALLGACLLPSPLVLVVYSYCMPVARSLRACCQLHAFICRAAALPAPLLPSPPGPQVSLTPPSCCLASLAVSTPLRRTRLLGTALPPQSPPPHMPFDCAFASTLSQLFPVFQAHPRERRPPEKGAAAGAAAGAK